MNFSLKYGWWALLVLGISSCQCKRYLQQYTTADQRADVVAWGKGGLIDACPGQSIHIGFPPKEQGYADTYLLPNDSAQTGAAAWLFTPQTQRDTALFLPIGKGSSFVLGGCAFQVLEVVSDPYADGQRPLVYVQLQRLPQACTTCNQQLTQALRHPVSLDSVLAQRRQ